MAFKNHNKEVYFWQNVNAGGTCPNRLTFWPIISFGAGCAWSKWQKSGENCRTRNQPVLIYWFWFTRPAACAIVLTSKFTDRTLLSAEICTSWWLGHVLYKRTELADSRKCLFSHIPFYRERVYKIKVNLCE